MRYPPYIEESFSFPEFFHVKMKYPRSHLGNVEEAADQTLAKVLPESGICSGDSVAVGVGSRGISNLVKIVRTVCQKLLQMGARPVIIPAMGSHGGATDKGQEEVLATLGITGESCGVPVKSSLEAEQIGTVFDQVPVFFSLDALEADHSICINRIKPHTKFKGPAESGIFKMLCIGMGKHQGALAYHKWALKYGFFPLLKAIGNEVMAKSNFRFGVGLVEDAYDETMVAEAILADQILERERELLEIARKNIPVLPVRQADVLVIQQIGKEISGAGMDPNVTGRAYDLKEDDFSGILQATRVAVLNLSDRTGGNGIGLGNADIITEKVFQGLDYETTVMNAMTGMSLRKAFIPVRLPDDRKAVQACFTTIGPTDPRDVRAIIIQDTLHVTEFWASEALLSEIQEVPEAQIIGKMRLGFDDSGNLELPGLSRLSCRF